MDVLTQYNVGLEEFLKLKEDPEAVLMEPISEGKWSIREIMGHLLYWDLFSLQTMVPWMAEGAKLPRFPDHDLHNAESILYINRYDNAKDLIDDFVKTRQRLVDELELISKELIFEIENEPQSFSAESYIAIFVEHDTHHLKQIRAKLKKKI